MECGAHYRSQRWVFITNSCKKTAESLIFHRVPPWKGTEQCELLVQAGSENIIDEKAYFYPTVRREQHFANE